MSDDDLTTIDTATPTLLTGRNLLIGNYELNPNGIRRANTGLDPTFTEWEALGTILQSVERAVQWWIGDWLLLGERDFDERAAQAVGDTGLQVETVKQYAWVAERVPPERRRPELTFTHHRAVAALESLHQDAWLDRAVDEGLSATKLERQIQTAAKPDPECWLLVRCVNPVDRSLLQDDLERTGRTTKLP